MDENIQKAIIMGIQGTLQAMGTQPDEETVKQIYSSIMAQLSKSQSASPASGVAYAKNGSKTDAFVKKFGNTNSQLYLSKFAGGGVNEGEEDKNKKSSNTTSKPRTDITESIRNGNGDYRQRTGTASVTTNADGSKTYTLTKNSMNEYAQGQTNTAAQYVPYEESSLTISDNDTTGVYRKRNNDTFGKGTNYITEYKYNNLPWWKRMNANIIPDKWWPIFRNNFPELEK